MMRQNIFENRKRQTPKMTFVFVLKPARAGFLVTNFLFQRTVPKYEHSQIQRQRHLDPPVS